MGETKSFHRITVLINRVITQRVLDRLKEIGLQDLYVAPARALIIRDRSRIFGIGIREDLIDTPMDIITFLTSPEMSDPLLHLVMDWGELHTHGRGSAYSEEVEVPAAHPVFEEASASIHVDAGKPSHALQMLQKICCIVQRGQGSAMAKVALYSGAGVPLIYFGNGTGVRNKMGLIRITIPAEKEIVIVSTTPHNCESVMDMMIDMGQLGQPGKGFIYTYMLKKGIADLQVSRGDRRHAATMEQIITTIDQIRGETEWRRWAETENTTRHKRRRYLTDYADLTLFCNAGKGTELVNTAMTVGVSGATITTFRHVCPPNSSLALMGMSRDACSMVIPTGLVPRVIEALGAAGAFSDAFFGRVQVRKIRKAFTYAPPAP